ATPEALDEFVLLERVGDLEENLALVVRHDQVHELEELTVLEGLRIRELADLLLRELAPRRGRAGRRRRTRRSGVRALDGELRGVRVGRVRGAILDRVESLEVHGLGLEQLRALDLAARLGALPRVDLVPDLVDVACFH